MDIEETIRHAFNEGTNWKEKYRMYHDKDLLIPDIERFVRTIKIPERFEMPTDKQLIKTAILFNDGNMDMDRLTTMLSMCEFVLDRLHENGNILVASKKENNSSNKDV